jgi:tetratricopeptide (TPR) repeat protein
VQAALTILAALDSPLPLSLLGSVVGKRGDQLLDEVGAFVSEVELDGTAAVVLAIPLGGVAHTRRSELLAATLRHLLDLAADRAQRPLATTQVRNIARLADQVLATDPPLVAHAFPVAEKLFKTTGNMQLALTTSRLSLRASEHPPASASVVSDQQLRDRAQTLICGESWVLQRIGELDEADRLALESLELGKRLGWDRNTAYCLKCRGRLLRMRGVVADDPNDRNRLSSESETLLRAAIAAFSSSTEFGPDHPEVGDCRSLLARTLFVAGRRREAWSELMAAHDLLEREQGQKDWADAFILEAEMLADENDARGALDCLNRVLEAFPASPDTDATEISARALALRGRVRAAQDSVAAASDLDHAAALYEALEDHYRADQQTWARLCILNAVPLELQGHLDEEHVSVRVAAVSIFERGLSASSSRAVGQRRGASRAHIRQVISEARLEAHRRELRWR